MDIDNMGANGPVAGMGNEHIKDSSTATFMADVVEGSATTPVIVDFWAPWCGPCLQFAPTFKEASEKIDGVTFAKVNTEEEQSLGAHFGIRSIPTLMIFRETIGIFSQPGSMTAKDLEDLLYKAKSIEMDEVRKELENQEQA